MIHCRTSFRRLYGLHKAQLSTTPVATLYPKKLGDILDVDKLLGEYPLYNSDNSLNLANVDTIQQVYVLFVK